MPYTPADGHRDPKAEARRQLFGNGAGNPARKMRPVPGQVGRANRLPSAREAMTGKAMQGLKAAMGGRGR